MRRHFRGVSAGALALGLVAGLTLWGTSMANGGAATAISSRCGSATQRPWCNTALSPLARATLLEGAMSTPDKITLLSGAAIPDVGIPAINFTDGALGVRGGTAKNTSATAMPSATALAANFNPFAAYLYGTVVGRDAKALGYDGLWGPTVNIMRTPLGGRTYEAYGEDPYLTSATGVGWIEGAQSQGVMADIKHFVANDQEGYLGVPLLSGTIGGRLFVNAVVDERTLREVYLPPFEAAVKQAHVATVMCGYNQVNGRFDCENGALLNGLMRGQWGFTGFVMSDAGAAHNTEGDLNGGTDFDILGSGYRAQEVQLALLTHLVSIATLDASVIRTLRTLFEFGFFDRPAYVDNEAALARTEDNATAQWVEEQGITLLQNTGHVLPLNTTSLSSLAVIGSTATTYTRGSGSSEVTPTEVVNPLQAIVAAAGPTVHVTYNGGGNIAQAAAAARGASAAVVFVRDSETEGTDKVCMSLDCPSVGMPDLNTLQGEQLTVGLQDQMIEAVAAANPNTIVVMETGAPVLTPWRNQVKGVLEAWYPGQQGGSAIARVLFGQADPGGRLPVTFPADVAQEPTAGNPASYPGLPTVDYTEGVDVGYRWFDAYGFIPAYPFGSGLSYTDFRYHDLHIAPGGHGSGTVASVSVQVTNTGSRPGTAVPELYLALPSQSGVNQPPNELKGYQKVQLDPGQTATVTFPLNDRSFAYWNTALGHWTVAPGCYGVNVGSSSAELPLTGTMARLGADCGGTAVVVAAPDSSASAAVLPDAPTVAYSG